jgi:protein-S-isoprenylcysteine O-methyltransferase Ste14
VSEIGRAEGPRYTGGVRYAVIVGLARMRVSLGFVFGVLVLILARPTGRSLTIGMSIAVCGEAFRIWASGHLNKAREVTASGPYRWFAHPLYLGSSVMGIGLAIACANVTVAVIIVVYLVTTLTAAIKGEEAYLRRAFGEQYDLYRTGIAAQRASPGAARRRFQVDQALANREYRAVIGLLVVILLLVLKATYNGSFWRATAGRP